MNALPSFFTPHGIFSFEWRGDVLLVTWSGEFNAEGLQWYFSDLKQQIANHPTRPIARLIDISNWEGVSHDAIEVYKEIAVWDEQQDPKIVTAIVVKDPFTVLVADSIAKKINAGAYIPKEFKSFYSIDDGLDYLRSMGIKTS